MTFLPKDYEAPVNASRYMKWKQGDNVFRILSDAVVGWEGWTEKKEVKRFKLSEKPTDLSDFKNEQIKHFWMFVVWNYETEQVEVLQITQSTIQKDMRGYTEDPDWGDPKGYDFVVTRDGEDLQTKYTTRAKPAKELVKVAKEAFEKETIDLERAFVGESIFANKADNENKDDDINPKDIM